MLSTAAFTRSMNAFQSCSMVDAACRCSMILVDDDSAMVSQMRNEDLLRWLPRCVSAHLQRELFKDAREQVALSGRGAAGAAQQMLRKSTAAARNTVIAATPAVASQEASIPAESKVSERSRAAASAATAALGVLSMALWPLVQDVQPEACAKGRSADISAVSQIECVCAVLLRLVTSNLGCCHDTLVAYALASPDSSILTSSVRAHLTASLKSWMQYFFLFFLDWLHRLRRSIAPTLGPARVSTKKPSAGTAATAASHFHTTKSSTDLSGDVVPHKPKCRQSSLLRGPLRGCSALLVEHPLHYYAQALQRTVAAIKSESDATHKCGGRDEDHDDYKLGDTTESCPGHPKRRPCAAHVLPVRGQRVASLGFRGVVRRRGVCARDRSSSSSSSSASPSDESPPLARIFLAQGQRRSLTKRRSK
ncbi:hypothetical protein JKF63_02721 [Porcisia hertigi]|uniref:Uncharacterized protein n=1 Tax=Porcisia hertigi TaxID=2761500 RepID=A0A836HRR3_9TRYP|nr:hypothetical protein JKF63_02721 [Porcisia hertigi]